jgi:hypothetical protein
MRKLNLILTCFFTIFLTTLALSQNFNWAKKIGSTGSDAGRVVKKDNNSNTYLAGYYQNTADLDPGSGVFNVTSAGNRDIYIIKIDSTGNFVWGKSVGGTNTDEVSDLIVDNNGNIYLCGFFRGTADFDPSSANFNLSTGNIGADGFILKLDINGSFIYAKQIGGTATVDDHVVSIDLDNQNNIYATGYFNNTCDLDPGIGQFNVTSVGGSDIFVLKLNSSGNFVYGKTVGGTLGTSTSGGSVGQSIKIDYLNNILISGYFDGTQDFDINSGIYNLTSNGQSDCFVLKLDLNGNFVFAKAFGGSGADASYSLNLDSNNDILLSGIFNSTVDFDPNTGVANLISRGSSDGFLLKLNSLGNYLWCNQVGGIGTDYSYFVAPDSFNNIFVTGTFSNSVDFDNSAGQLLLNSNGLKDVFVAAYNSSGSIIYAQNYGSTADDEGVGIYSSGNEIYLTGYFQNTVDFDAGTNVFNLSSAGSLDAFVLVLNNSFCTQTNVVTVYDTITTTIYDTITTTVFDTVTTTVYDTITTFISVTDTLIINAVISSVNPPNNVNTVLVYPNPANTHITIDNGNFALMNGYTVRINNALGQTVFTQQVTQQQFFIDLSTWSGPGLYYLDLIDNNGSTISSKVIVIQ